MNLRGQTLIGPECAWCGLPAEGEIQVEAEQRETENRKRKAARNLPACGQCIATVKTDGPMGMPLRRKARGVVQRELFDANPLGAIDP